MSFVRIRLPKVFVVIGLALLVFSSLGDISLNRRSSVDANYGSYGVRMFSTTSSISIRVEEWDNKRFSLYMVTYSDAMMVLNGSSLEQVNSFFIKENVTSIDDVVGIWSMGIYGILVTPVEPNIITVNIILNVTYPLSATFVPGLILTLLGLLVIVYPEIMYLLQYQPPQEIKTDD